MSEAEEPKPEGGESKKPPGNKKLLMIVGGVVGVLLFIGIPAGIFLAHRNGGSVPEAEQDAVHANGLMMEGHGEEEELLEGEEPLGAMFPMDTFVVNVSGGGFIRTQLQVEFTERDIPPGFYSRISIMRDGMISLFSARTRENLLTEKGRVELKAAIKDLINKTLKKDLVKQVYFTQYVVQ